MNRAENYSLLLLAGGKSRRMGTDKAELVYAGKSFLENSIEKAKMLGIDQIYLCGQREAQHGVHIAEDIYPGMGPMAGLHAGMKKMKTAFCLVLPVDVPQIPRELLNELLEYHEKNAAMFLEEQKPLVIKHQEMLEPLIGIYPTAMADVIEGRILEQQLSVHRMLKHSGCECYETEIPEWQIANINPREEYGKLLKRV